MTRDALITFAAATMALIGCSGTLTLAGLHVAAAQASRERQAA